MDTIDPLSRLNQLDAALHQGLRHLPTLLSTIDQRYRDAMPGPLGAVPLDQLYLDQAPLTHHLCNLALGNPLPEGQVQRLTAEGFVPLSELEDYRARRFLSRSGNDLLQLHLDALKRFWMLGAVEGQPARQWLKNLCREHLRAQAQLRRADNTLAQPSWLQVSSLTDADLASSSRPWRGAVILHSGGTRWALPGAVVICERDPHLSNEPVLLNTLTHGLETFDSLAALYQELAERLEDDRQGPGLLAALDPEHQDQALRCDALTFERVPGDLFDFLQANLERRQQAAVAYAWKQAGADFELRDLDNASQTLASAADLGELLSSRGPRLTRYMLLLERDMPAWMANLSQAQRLEMIQGMRELGLATANAIAPGLPSPRQFSDPRWLREYAHQRLARLLRQEGINVAPDRILITVTSADPSGPLLNPTNPSGSVPTRAPQHTGPTIVLTSKVRTLVQLAIENLSLLDWDYLLTAVVRDDAGQPIPGLTPAAVRKLVRRVNVGGQYGRYLLDRLRYGEEAQWRRERHARLLRAKMHVEALKDRHRGHLGPASEAWHWIAAVLAEPAPHRRPRVSSQAIGVWQLLIRGTPVDGVYLFGPIQPASPQPVALYTPGSPARQSWRWFPNRQAVASEWLNQPEIKGYIQARVALAERKAIGELLGTPRLASLIEARLVNHDFFDNAYRSETRLVMANADALSASNQEIDLQTVADIAVTLSEIVCMLLPSRITGVFAVTRAIWSFMQAYLAIGEEPESVVLLHAFDAYANLFEASVALSASPLFGKLARRMPLGTPVPLHTQYAIRHERIFLRYRLATDYVEGVYETQGTDGGASLYFITDRDGLRYEVRNDGLHWRVVDARMPHALYKPIVRRNRDGDWEMVDEIRWRGVVPDVLALLQRLRLTDPPQGVAPGLPTLIGGQHYLRIRESVLIVRPSLLPGRYTVVIPLEQRPEAVLTVILRHTAAGGWEAQARQSDMSSEWFDV